MIAIPSTPTKFAVGQLVKHRRYGYRGVVVAIDTCCRAPHSWYQANKTQPDRRQPWYHVIVHDQDCTTYAAQTSLKEDDECKEIKNPLVHAFFDAFVSGDYVRNGLDWPSWDGSQE
jgi:heat shock protein HspQ